jgi:diacylglycerol kinase (ATP)
MLILLIVVSKFRRRKLSKQEILFVINPNAGRDRNKDYLLKQIETLLDKSKFNPIILFTERPCHAKEIVNEYLKKGIKEFVAVGGDGTINEIGSQLLYKDVVLNIISKGSGNGLARHLGIFQDEKLCIQRINTGTVKEIDAGLINKTPFLCVAGFGFDAFTARQFSLSTGRGLRNYIKVSLLAFFKYKSIELDFNGSSYKVFSLTFGNASQFGNNAYIAPEADISDGLLDCCIAKEHPKRNSLKLLYQLFTKQIKKSKFVEYYQGQSFELTTHELQWIHFDGEPKLLDSRNVKIEVLAKALKIRI